jgi:hypothetical protein
VATLWDFNGALVSYTKLPTAPTVNPTFSQTDAHGNPLYNANNQAYLVLAPGFIPAPRVAGVSPNVAPQGSTVTIAGTGFTGATAVSFGKLAAASYTINSDTSITAVAPAVRSGTVDVTVTDAGGRSATNAGDRFTFALTPRVVALSPNSGSTDGGIKVKIIGVNFIGATAVSFGGVPARFTVASAKSILAVSPPGPDSGVTVDVTVTSAHGTSSITTGDRYTFTG